MSQLSKLREGNRSHIQSQKKRSLVVNPIVVPPPVSYKKMSVGSQSILKQMDSMMEKHKNTHKETDSCADRHKNNIQITKVSSKNRLREDKHVNTSYADSKLFKPLFGKLDFFEKHTFHKMPPKKKLSQAKIQTIGKSSFSYEYIVGKGGFGKVWKVVAKKSGHDYALKEMLKALVLTKKSTESVLNERQLLSAISNPFIVNIHYAFQDRDTLYLAMDLMPGGDLRYHIGTRKSFTQTQTKFFVACIVLGLQYIRTQNIIHRDIKPENLVLDSKGYIMITDFGIAKLRRDNNSTDTSGTPGYMSPEVICRQDHSFESDYFALGVIAYELMFQKRPYLGCTRAEIRDQILARQVQIKPHEVPDGWSSQAVDFVNRLIQRKPYQRLGHGGMRQIKEHPWLRDLSWKKLNSKQLQSPFIPNMKKGNFDQDAQITLDDQKQLELIEKNTVLLRKQEFQDIFKDYFYDEDKSKSTQETEPLVNSFEENTKMSQKTSEQLSMKPQRIAKLSVESIVARRSKEYNRM